MEDDELVEQGELLLVAVLAYIDMAVDEDQDVQYDDDHETYVLEKVDVLQKQVDEGQRSVLYLVSLFVLVEEDKFALVLEDGLRLRLDRSEVYFVQILLLQVAFANTLRQYWKIYCLQGLVAYDFHPSRVRQEESYRVHYPLVLFIRLRVNRIATF